MAESPCVQASWPEQYSLTTQQLAELMSQQHLDEEQLEAASYAPQVGVWCAGGALP